MQHPYVACLCQESHTHTRLFYSPFFRDYPGELVPKEIFFWTFMVQGKITDNTPTIRLGATPSRLISNPPPSSPHFYTRCLSCRNPPNLSWLATGTKYAGLHLWGKGAPIVKYRKFLPCAVQKWLNQSISHLGYGLGWVQRSTGSVVFANVQSYSDGFGIWKAT